MRWCSLGGRRDAGRVGAGGEGSRLGLRRGGRSAGTGRGAPAGAAAGRAAGESRRGAQRRSPGGGAVERWAAEAATSSLHTYVSRLRRLLPPSVRLETAAPGYRLRVAVGAADVARFETALH